MIREYQHIMIREYVIADRHRSSPESTGIGWQALARAGPSPKNDCKDKSGSDYTDPLTPRANALSWTYDNRLPRLPPRDYRAPSKE